ARSPLWSSGPRYFPALGSRVATPMVTDDAVTPRTDPCPDDQPVAAAAPADTAPRRAPAGPPWEPAAAGPPACPAAPPAAATSAPSWPAVPPTATCVARPRAAGEPLVCVWARTPIAARATPSTR